MKLRLRNMLRRWHGNYHIIMIYWEIVIDWECCIKISEWPKVQQRWLICLLQTQGASCCAGESSDGSDWGSEESDYAFWEGDAGSTSRAVRPAGGQRPLSQQHHEKSGGGAEETAHKEGQTYQGCSPFTVDQFYMKMMVSSQACLK